MVDFYLDLNTLKTGNSRRDRDMYETLNSDELPFAEFTGQLLDSIDERIQGPQTVRVRGEMSIHGVSRDLEVEGTVQLDDEQLNLQADWILNITHYDIEPPGILFYRVRDEMDVHIDAVMNRGAPPAEPASEASAASTDGFTDELLDEFTNELPNEFTDDLTNVHTEEMSSTTPAGTRYHPLYNHDSQ